MQKALVGYTGFVGSNIAAKTAFDGLYNSKNIEEAYGTKPDLLVYAGLRAEKYLANNAPEKDMALIKEAEENIRKIGPKRLVLISTVDVYRNPVGVDEESRIDLEELQPYGYNRYVLEEWVRENYKDALIIRLPGLYGKNIKKNFIYDYINVIPFMLKETKMEKLAYEDADLKSFYSLQDNGFYKCRELNGEEKTLLKKKFREIGFSALSFTDSRNQYQFYPLSRLWGDIEIALEHGITLWNPATEPIRVETLYRYLTEEEFCNHIMEHPISYDYRTEYATLFGGKEGYIMDKESVMRDIKQFIEQMEE